ncbi:MAG TPA: radical SAM family heme chaperone HemW [Burkholderiaceae bacterium]|nr:radical SAM family heme chaperone HemW [Burkholderiaceae bacterium]
MAPSGPEPASIQHYLRPGVLSLTSLPPLSLYVHIPWCVRKCPYCDFNSHENPGGLEAIPEQAYLEALRVDLETSVSLIWGRPVTSVFIGGGTPSVFSARAIETLLSDIRALLPLQADCEITLEANPGTFEADKFAAFRAAGVNRLSLGIQSFDETKLTALGRIHDRSQALAAAACAQRLFANFNLDLMYGLPGQQLSGLQADVEQALDFSPPHLSLYQLTVEANTVFAKFPPALPDDDQASDMFAWIEDRITGAGFSHYEVSAYARQGCKCRHNLNYWMFGDYLGIGAGAHSKLSFPHRIVRQVRWRQPHSYLANARCGDAVAESKEVPRADVPFEFMLNALRLIDGVPVGLFAQRTGMPISQVDPLLARAVERGLLSDRDDVLAPTPLGQRFLSDLQSIFL